MKSGATKERCFSLPVLMSGGSGALVVPHLPTAWILYPHRTAEGAGDAALVSLVRGIGYENNPLAKGCGLHRTDGERLVGLGRQLGQDLGLAKGLPGGAYLK